jgi:hypothetical protein
MHKLCIGFSFIDTSFAPDQEKNSNGSHKIAGGRFPFIDFWYKQGCHFEHALSRLPR